MIVHLFSVLSQSCAGVQVLTADPTSVKGLYRRAQAHLGQQDFVEAEVNIKAALQVHPWLPVCELTRHAPSVKGLCRSCYSPKQPRLSGGVAIFSRGLL